LSLPLAQEIANRLGMRTGMAFSRGSAGLYALLASLARSDGPGEVIVPTLCCQVVGLAAAYAGHELRFADASPHSLCATPETVAPLMSTRTRAVVVAHVYGVDADADEFSALRLKFPQAAFIEDVACALGGRDRHGKLLGGAMDYTLLSFADDKIIPGDGGMLLFADGAVDPFKVAGEIPDRAPQASQRLMARSLRDLTHGLADLQRESPSARIGDAFVAVLDAYRDLIMRSGGIGDERAVASGFDTLDEDRSARYQNYSAYRDGVATEHATVVELHNGSTCWRCPILFDDPGRARMVTEELRAAGVHASNHYFPLNLLWGDGRDPVAEDISRRVVCVWTAGDTPRHMIDKGISIINHH